MVVGTEYGTAKALICDYLLVISYRQQEAPTIQYGTTDLDSTRPACIEWCTKRQAGTCAQDLEQLVNHVLRQLITGSSSAPESPAQFHSSDRETCY